MFKIVTLAGLLDAGVVKRSAKFPVETFDDARGRRARERQRRGVRRLAGAARSRTPATRCSRRWGPKLGAERLVEAAERFGFNEEPSIAGAARSTIPPGGRDRRRPRGRLDRDRPGQGADDAAADGRGRGGDRRGRPPAAADAAQGRRRDRRARHHARVRPLHRPRDAPRSSPTGPASAPRSRASGWRARPARPSCARRSARTPIAAGAGRAGARGGRHRHRRLVRGVRADAQPARGGQRPARRSGRRRRHRRAGGEDRHRGRAER